MKNKSDEYSQGRELTKPPLHICNQNPLLSLNFWGQVEQRLMTDKILSLGQCDGENCSWMLLLCVSLSDMAYKYIPGDICLLFSLHHDDKKKKKITFGLTVLEHRQSFTLPG